MTLGVFHGSATGVQHIVRHAVVEIRGENRILGNVTVDLIAAVFASAMLTYRQSRAGSDTATMARQSDVIAPSFVAGSVAGGNIFLIYTNDGLLFY